MIYNIIIIAIYFCLITFIIFSSKQVQAASVKTKWIDKHNRMITIKKDVKIQYYERKINNKWVFHNDNGPARIVYDQFGDKFLEEYYKNNLKHREDGPAVVYYSNNNIISQQPTTLKG